jgi:cathepsin L
VLSMQELVSCVGNPRDCGGQGGCTGSTAELCYDFVATHGVVTEWQFGYQSFHGERVNCTLLDNRDEDAAAGLLRGPTVDGGTTTNIKGAVASIVGFANLPMNQYQTFLNAVANFGPVVINVAAAGWGLYSHGVFDDDKGTTRDVNHAVVLEGYGTDEETGQDYWLIRNSWGPIWGEEGYIRLKRVDPSTLEDPASDCKMDTRPADGIACTKDEDGTDITPKEVQVCGTSGVLYDGVIPIGGHLL